MQDNLAVGYIYAVKGLNGEVKVKPLSSFDRFYKGSKLQINPPLVDRDYLTVEKSIKTKDHFNVKFVDINNSEEANKIKKHYLETSKVPLPEGTFYSDDLIDLNVLSNEKKVLGKVSAIKESKAHDILVVKGKKTFFVPVTKEFIKEIDIDNKVIIINPIEGLI